MKRIRKYDIVGSEISQTATHTYTGRFELTPDGLIYHTDEGHYDLTESRHYWHLRDRMGSTAAVVDGNGTLVQTTGYYPSGTPYRVPATGIQTAVDEVTDELHIGNKWLGHSGLNMYDNTARLHDPLLMRFASPDPLYAKFGSLSPWSHCAADPLNHFDPDGEKPTKYEAALMAKNVYESFSNRKKFYKNNWHISSFKTSIDYEDNITGFKSCLYERTENGVTEYAYVYAGTDGDNINDWTNNIAQIAGVAPQYKQAIHNASILSKELGNAELTFVGHSLGGGLATASSLKTGRDAITFNPAAITSKTKSLNGLSGSGGNITNYITSGVKVKIPFVGKSFWLGGDPLYNAQKGVGLKLHGKIIFIPTGSIAPSHSIDKIVEVLSK